MATSTSLETQRVKPESVALQQLALKYSESQTDRECCNRFVSLIAGILIIEGAPGVDPSPYNDVLNETINKAGIKLDDMEFGDGTWRELNRLIMSGIEIEKPFRSDVLELLLSAEWVKEERDEAPFLEIFRSILPK